MKLNNWLNEIVHRFKYEKINAAIPKPKVIDFLAPEILKEIFFRYKQADQIDLYHFDLTKENLSQNSLLTKKAMMMIEAHLFKSLSLEDITEHLATSESTLLRALKTDMGKSPINYQKERRLDESLLLLKSKKYNVSEVGNMIGYENISAFISAFKKRFNQTPNQII